MDFRRIDKNTVQCVLSEEEMNEYGFRIEDFFSDQEKAREFLEHLVERAEEETGYNAQGGVISMQITKLPEDAGIVITLSERDPGSMDGFQNMLQHLHQQLASLVEPTILGRIIDEEDLPEDEMAAEEEIQDATDMQKQLEKHGRESADGKKRNASVPCVFRFHDFRRLEQLAASVVLQKNINSAIYYDSQKENYYLLLKKGKLTLEEYRILCDRFSEYADVCTIQPYAEQFCKEHFEPLMPKHALRILKEIVLGTQGE